MNMEKSMREIIHENHERALRADREIIKRRRRKEKILTILEITVALILFFAVIFVGYKYDQKTVSNCINAGYDENYCEGMLYEWE